jgi:hypothetical protein
MTADITLVTKPLAATRFFFAYDDPEDRLMLLATDSEDRSMALALTRRLTGRLINALCVVLEKSSINASTAPADLRDDIILLEHQGALSAHSAPAPVPRPPVPGGPRGLMTNVEITTLPDGFGLTFRDARQPKIQFKINRVGLHRMLEVIARHAEAANWHIAIESSSLEPGQKHIVLN